MKRRISIWRETNEGNIVIKKHKNAFTIVEVSILFVIFLIVAFLVVPLSLDDSMQAKNASRWRNVQSDFQNLFYSVNLQVEDDDVPFKEAFDSVMNGEIKSPTKPYKITFMNGTFPSGTYRFVDYNLTQANATLAYKLFEEQQNGIYGVLMYDVNGPVGPNV